MAVALLVATSVPAFPALGAEGQTRVYVNVHVFTADPAAPFAEAVAVRAERIVAVGERSAVQAAAGSGAQVVDLGGRFLMPGMIDAHAHPIGSKVVLGGGYGEVMANYTETTVSIDGLAAFVRKVVDEGTSRFGDVFIVNGVDIGHWSHTAELEAALSSGRTANVPVVLVGNDGHTAWCNRAMRTRAGIDAAMLRALPKSERIYYGYGPNFESNGFVVDKGLTRLRQFLPEPSPEFLLSAGRAGLHYMNALGITGWVDAAVAGVVGGDVPLRADETGALPVYRELARRGELTAHVAAYPVIMPRGGIPQIDVMQAMQREFAGIPNLTIPGIKVFADGVVEFPSQTAALSTPYLNSGRKTPLLFDPVPFNALVTEADRRGLSVHIHAIGNLAVKASLDAIAAARTANPGSHLPHTITHVQFIDDEDVPRFARYDVIAALQLLWALADPSTNEEIKPYIDPQIHHTLYAARSLLEAGTVIAGASDWPVSSANPFWAMAQAETRVGPQGVLTPEQRMPRMAMLYAYTRNAARAIGQLDQVGTLEAGKRADMVLVDRDLLTASADELRDARVLWTMFSGKLIYEAPR